jgi:hypothetical protein
MSLFGSGVAVNAWHHMPLPVKSLSNTGINFWMPQSKGNVLTV